MIRNPGPGGAIPLAASAAMLFFSTAGEAAPTCMASPADASAITEAVRAMYDAAMSLDPVRWRTQLTPDFHIFDEGVRRTGNELIDAFRPLVQHLRSQDNTMTWRFSFDDPRIEVDCGTALATFTTRSVVNLPKLGQHKDATYLDSFWLRKEDGRWRIAFQQTTWAPQEPSLSEKK